MTGAIIISTYCDNNCLFCKGIPKRIPYNLLIEQESLIMANIDQHLQNGVDSIEISGADPGEYGRIENIVSYLKSHGVKYVRLSTNANRLADNDLVIRLAESGLDNVKIPLYGSCSLVHERIARKEGSFRLVMQALNNLSKTSIGITFCTLIVKQNMFDMKHLFELMRMYSNDIHASVPCIADGNYDFYIPASQFNVFKSIYTPDVTFDDIPYCVLGQYADNLRFTSPPDQGTQQPRPGLASEIRNVPVYRLKAYAPMCDSCSLRPKCGGFYKNDLDKFGSEGMKPL